MSSIQKFRCTQFKAVGDEVFTIDPETNINNLQVTCVSGEIRIEGSAGRILGKATTFIGLLAGQSFNFTGDQYDDITITVRNGSSAIFVSN